MQDGIDIDIDRGKIFWQINKRAGWKFSGKSIIVQLILIFETEKVIVKLILTFLLSYLSLFNKIVGSF